MKKIIIITSVVLGLTGCPGQQAGTADRQQAALADMAPEAAAPVSAIASSFAYSPLPPGVVLQTPFHVRGDRIYVTPKGMTRRVGTLELLEGDAIAVATGLETQMADAGFRTLVVPQKEDGMARFAYDRKDYGRINVYAQADVGANPFHPDAVGIIKFDWPLDAQTPR